MHYKSRIAGGATPLGRINADFSEHRAGNAVSDRAVVLHYYKSANYAFTLAEVLITLGVIGIVAAIAIPSLINHYNDKVLETKYKKTKSILINGYKLMMAKNQVFDISQLPFTNDFDEYVAQAHKDVFKILSDTKGGLDAETLPKDYAIEDNDSPSQFNWEDVPYIFQTTDGMLMGVEQDAETKNIYIYTDTNGNSNPNEIGKDMYKFSISGNALLADVSGELTESSCSIDNLEACNTEEQCRAINDAHCFSSLGSSFGYLGCGIVWDGVACYKNDWSSGADGFEYYCN